MISPRITIAALASLAAIHCVAWAEAPVGTRGPVDRRPQESAGIPAERSEAVASTAQTILARLSAAFVEGGEPFATDEERAVVAPDAVGVVRSEPAAWDELIFQDPAPLTARQRPAPDFGAAPTLDPGTGREDTFDDVRAAFAAVRAELGGLPTRSLELATKRVEPVAGADGEVYDTRVRMRAVRIADGEPARLVRAIWLARWSVDGDAVQLVAFEQHLVESAAATDAGPGRPWMPDVAPDAFGGSPAALARARMSIHALRDVLDVDLGVGVLGHHGVAIGDLNGDGIDDVFLPQPGGVPNQVWIRLADGSAIEVSEQAGLDHLDPTTSALLLDLDGDGDRDVVLGLGGGLQLMVQGPTGFDPGPFIERGSMTSLAAADVDDDGRVDLYACAYADPYRGVVFPVPYHDAENGQANILLMNRTTERDELVFEDETDARGLGVGATRFSFAATFDDIDDDGDVDLYVANDFGRNALYVNDGTGRFRESAAVFGVQDIAAGMGAAFDDIDGDGLVDLYVTNMESSAGRRVTGRGNFRPDMADDARALYRRHAKGNTLFLGSPRGGFVEAAGIAAQGRWAWGGLPCDLDGDGRLDLFVPNGFVSSRRGGKPDL